MFENLRKEAEGLKAKTREKVAVVEKPTPATIAKDAAPAAITPSTTRKSSLPRIGLYIVIGALVAAGAWWVSAFMNQQTDQPQAQPVIRTMAPPKPGEPKPTTGALSITSEPAGATVLFGTETKGVTPLKLTDLPFGKHTVTLKLKGFQDMVQDVELNENQFALEMPAVLQAAVPQIGVLVIESNPPGAFIAMGSRVVGQTPKTLDKANAGKYNITLKKEGYLDFAQTVRVKENETTTLTAQLTEIPKPVVVAEKPKEPELKPGTLVTLGPGVIAPKTRKKTSVEYPDAARRQKLEGTVQLNLLISETGQVLDVKVLKSAHPILDDAAVRTVKQWQYDPAKKQNIPVKVWLSTSITFVKR